jgi:(1->4)-alpha-D-glucan 1-alpha-D-glucosylmutase
MKFQQLTGPVMAKGLEDTAFYVYNRLTSLNEVGGDPSQFGLPVAEFHRQNAARLAEWPRALLASSTHDTKRSEDVRARIAVLSELPREWRAALNRWARFNRKLKTRVEGSPAPDRNDEYLLYQTLIGAWPTAAAVPDAGFVERIVAYLLKAIHEAQVHTSWINPNEEYDRATETFARRVLATENERFLTDFASFGDRIRVPGAWNALSQQLLKLTAPGVPDLYQGTEFWDDSLVDPDNRRPVDFARREQALAEIGDRTGDAELLSALAGDVTDPRLKLFITHAALAFRRDAPELFANGDYLPFAVSGARAEHAIAFARRHGDRVALVAAPRLLTSLVRGGESPVGTAW